MIRLFALLLRLSGSLNIILTNDDGWATSQIRAQKFALDAAGFNTVLSAPAQDQSGSGSRDTPPVPLRSPCQFNTCPTGAPAEGFNASDPTLNYINSYPVTAVRYGIQTLAPKYFGGRPDIVISGPNIGNNLGLAVFFSGTVGAACEAALEGIPSIALSAKTGSPASYTTLQANSTQSLYASVAPKLLRTLTTSPPPFLPQDIVLNVNYPAITPTCSSASSFQFVLTRIFPTLFHDDVRTCGSSKLPTESEIVGRDECLVSVSVMSAKTKRDVDKDVQSVVLERLKNILVCP